MPKPVAIPPPGFDDLSVEEQIDYVQLLWERIAATPDQVPVPDWHREVLNERVKDYEANPGTGESWTLCAIDFGTRCASASVMARRWIVRPLAESDLDRAASWDQDQKSGLGMRFLEAANQSLARVRETPLQFPIVSHGIRRALLHTFPYAVYFSVMDDDAVMVLAVLHLRRDHRNWRADRILPRSADARLAKLHAEVLRAINAADPIGLLASGAPEDEYSPEIGTVVPRLAKAQTEQECLDLLHEEFVRWFSADMAGPRDAYAKLAADLWQAVLQFLAS